MRPQRRPGTDIEQERARELRRRRTPPDTGRGRANTNCIQPAVVKNQEPMKHNRLHSPAPAVAEIPGIVATANKVEPIANSQHCR
jgi:hypothetical protein